MNIQAYLDTVRAKYGSGVATEHSYRPALETLLASAGDGLQAVNEPRRVACGAPDFVVMRKGIDIGHCEAKDLHIDLAKLKDANLDQKKRYLKALPNLIYTNGVDFEFYKSGEKLRSISIGVLTGSKIEAIPDNFAILENQLKTFASETPQSITSAKKLAEMMAGKAILIKDIMGNALRTDAHLQTELTGQFAAFKAHLIHDIDADEFADVYAETIAYGLFAARLHDTSIDSFDRREALELLPKSNPFLRSLFGYIAGVDLDDRIAWVIDELCDVLRACNLHDLMQDFGKWTARNDPFLHFYETFLAEYNPAKRKARGVWYTPEPVVNFIVRAVDDVLKSEFGLPMGLADTSKISVDWDTGQTDAKGKRVTLKKQVHRVQILDPATGTGTFLAEAVKQIAAKVKGIAPGMWSSYVEADLIPRIHGFELLMASYAMCHMKLDMMLADLGYVPSATPPRLSVYLTNSLEEGDAADQQLPFARWLSEEAKGANTIKRDTPIMCVIGNPPYSGESANKGDWIMGLMEAYKKEPGGKVRLDERNPKWINDDYVKFIRFAEHMIEKNGEGVLGFITNHGYLDNPTFRGMRWHLLDTFDKIYVLDLHGNAKKLETTPQGGPDKNVFDIMQGVAIILAVKRLSGGKAPNELAKILHGELWGTREFKNDALWTGTIHNLISSSLPYKKPSYPFVVRDYSVEKSYEQGFSLADLMPVNAVGMMSKRDHVAYADTALEMSQRVQDFLYLPATQLESKYGNLYESRDWSIDKTKKNIKKFGENNIEKVLNFPFDIKFTYHTDNSRGFLAYPVFSVMRHMHQPNVALINSRITKDHTTAFVSSEIISHKSVCRYDGSYLAPLYLYPEPGSLDTERRVNFDPKLYAKIRAAAGLDPSGSSPARGGGPPLGGGGVGSALPPASGGAAGTPPPHEERGPPPPMGEDQEGDRRPPELLVFDYIYGVLHAPNYRATYAQFLKIDFPRIPYPASPAVFAAIAAHGSALRRLHLMEDAAIGDTPYPFIGAGDGVVGKPEFKIAPGETMGRVYINAEQYFDTVPAVAWGFHIGGYQPAQKWLKDRKGRALGFDDVRHYQKIIKILVETDRIMAGIDLPLG